MAAKYLKHFPSPLLDDLVKGRWLPIVGAGLSRNAVLPSGQTMPLWNELGKRFAEDMQGYKYTNAIDTVSAYEYQFGRPKLIEKLSDLLFLNEAQPIGTHRAFCDVEFDIVCTTNFDFLLEKGYENISRFCTPIIDEDQLSINRTGRSTVLLKLHGDLHHPKRLVVTEEDYDLFLERYPLIATYLANLLITRTAVLIGYSLDDPDFRQLWQVIGERLGKARRLAYALCVDAQPAEAARFKRRGVEVINLPGNKAKYGEILSKTFEELRDYWRENILNESQVTEEKLLRELVGSEARLCYFSLPLSAHPFYREQVFPLVREAGLVPVTGDEIISPGDNWVVKTEALISRAFLVLVDASSDFAVAEARIAIARKKPDRVRIIFKENVSIPSNIPPVQILQRPSLLEPAEHQNFLSNLQQWFLEAAEKLEPRLSEARRLLNAKEYRASVVSAITHLETTMKKWSDSEIATSKDRRFVSLRQMLLMVSEKGLLGRFEVRQVWQWLKVRNDVVHSNAPVSARKAEQIVSGVEEITSSLQ